MGILDSLTKNPSLIALAALGIGLFVFRDKISGFFSGITGGAQTVSNLGETGNILSENLLGNVTGLQDIFKGISEFEFPKIELPSFEFPSFELPDLSNLFGSIGTSDITETPAAIGRASDRGRTIPEMIESIIPSGGVQSAIPDQQFFGGGPSFVGGVVRETPITGESTLGFIIDKLGVSASRAASIRAEARGFTPEETSFLGIGDNPPSVSGGFEGLTPEEIALRLTGGVITNF